MTKLRAIGAAVVACVSVAITHVTADDITDATADIIQKWANAVETHVAGRPDAAVAMVCGMSYRDRADMNAGINLFFMALPEGNSPLKGSRAFRAVVAVAHAAGQPLPARFLKRAGILHTDAAIFRALFPRLPDPTAPNIYPNNSPGPGPRLPSPPLLSHKRLVLDQDAEIVGSTIADWNWPFARDLLDRLISRSEQERDPFLGAWYHAVAAYMLVKGLYGDADDHLNHAAEILPNDARVVFDRASLAEILGLPKFQVPLIGNHAWSDVHIAPAFVTTAEADRVYRRALNLDPTLVEARVRLARLLDLRGAHAEALLELRIALDASPPRIVAFYAHLFAARASLHAGSVPDASNHYRDALSLYPNAQSALLGVSETALLAGDVTGAIAPVERLGATSAPLDADPWWQYGLAAGRDVNELMAKLWEATPSGSVRTGRLQ